MWSACEERRVGHWSLVGAGEKLATVGLANFDSESFRVLAETRLSAREKVKRCEEESVRRRCVDVAMGNPPTEGLWSAVWKWSTVRKHL